MKTRIKIACDFCSIELVLVQTDVTKLSDNFVSGQALCFNLYPGTKIRNFFFVRMKYIKKRLPFKFLKINAILFIFCGQNKIANGDMRSDCFSQHMSYILNTYHMLLMASTASEMQK